MGGTEGDLARSAGGAEGDFARSGSGGIGGALGDFARAAPSSFATSIIAFSSAWRSAEPGGGGGTVRGFLRGVAPGGAAGSGAVAAGGGSTCQPSARSAMRSFVASPSRRRVRSSSGTARP
jgi:hypothetical protein